MTELLNGLIARASVYAYSLKDRQDGQAMVEYSLVLVLIALATATAFTGIGTKMITALGNVASAL